MRFLLSRTLESGTSDMSEAIEKKTTLSSKGAFSISSKIPRLVLNRHGLVKVSQPAIAWLGALRTRGARAPSGGLGRRDNHDHGRNHDGSIGRECWQFIVAQGVVLELSSATTFVPSMKIAGTQPLTWKLVALFVTYTDVYIPFISLEVYANNIGILISPESYILSIANAARVPKRITLTSIADSSLLCCIYHVVSATVLCFLFDSESSKTEYEY